MSFKKFKADVATAAQKAAGGGISGVLSVAHGDSDGEVVIKYHHEDLPEDVRIQALAQNVGEYPDGNMFLVWTDDNDPPPPVVAAVKAAQDYLMGLSVYEMVTELAKRLENAVRRAVDGEDGSLSEADETSDDDNDYDAAYDADYPSDGDEFGLPSSAPRHSRRGLRVTECSTPLLQRIRRDLRKARDAGYKVGVLDAFGRSSASGIVSISIRVDSLALSVEAMEAWDVKPAEYFVLLLRSEKRYDPLELVTSRPAVHTELNFRIGKCNRYKPLPAQAFYAFTGSHPLSEEDPEPEATTSSHPPTKFEKLFISSSLEQFMCDSFVPLLHARENEGLGWDEANELLLVRRGLSGDDQQPPNPGAAPTRDRDLGPDHLLEDVASERSLPLVAMQVATRYFVKCTEYCLRCHRRLDKELEALRPYVCSDPLCLFQYMAMGFGPSIEHEVLTEPYVVDLLVSLCYAAIQPCGQRQRPLIMPPVAQNPHIADSTPAEVQLPIRSLPVGLRLMVPNLSGTSTIKARTAANNTWLVFEEEGFKDFGDRLSPGKWLAFRRPGQSLAHHARVQEIRTAFRIAVMDLVGASSTHWGTGQHSDPYASVPPSDDLLKVITKTTDSDVVEVFLYDADFDSLDVLAKGDAMRHILDTLPPILEIEEWLASHPNCPLRSMERISPAAASLLQWIVSSNRSCIFQVDRSRAIAKRAGGARGWTASEPQTPATEPEGDLRSAGRGANREAERILGMDGWIQFRFAQGAPDKELRFKRALHEVATRKGISSHPTIFAWHGSNLANWHSIVRTGLDYQDIRTGRSFGNGVYFSRDHNTSMGYAGGGQTWPNSDLNFGLCLSLNEIINAPDEFVSSQPHYVVSQADWHQCRYLFVQTAAGRVQQHNNTASKEAKSKAKSKTTKQPCYPQAPGHEVRGKSGAALEIPLCAIPLRTIGPEPKSSSPSPGKRPAQQQDDSEEDDAEDWAMLFSDDELAHGPSPSKKWSPHPSNRNPAASRDMYVPAQPPPPQMKLTIPPTAAAAAAAPPHPPASSSTVP